MRTPLDGHPDVASIRPTKAWRLLPPLGVALLVLVTFVPAMAAGFVGWDDDDLLLGETRYRTLTGPNLVWMFTTSYTGHFQPLTWLSYWLDVKLWSLDPAGFHITNVLLHTASAVVFFFVARRLILLSSVALTPKSVQLAAALSAVVFAVHPLRVESVAWIAERRDVLGALLFLGSVACYLRYAQASSSRSRLGWYAGVIALCGLSLLSKATAVMLPLVLWILDYYPLRRFSQGNSALRRDRRVWTEKLPLLALSLVAGARALAAQRTQGALVPWAEHDIVARLVQACYGLVFYVWKTFVPAQLGPLYEIPGRQGLLGQYAWAVLVAAGLAALAIAARRRFPSITAAFATYVIMLAPVLGFAQSGPQWVADRYSYVACMGFAILIGFVVVQGWAWAGRRRDTRLRAALVLATAITLTLLQNATARQCELWQSGRSLWAHAVAVAPESAISHANLADELAATGELDAAVLHYERSLDLRAHDPITTHHLADAFRLRGNGEQAIVMYLRTLQLDVGRTEAHFQLAGLLIHQGRASQAAAILRERLRRQPDDLRAVLMLAELLSTHPDAGVRNADEAVRLAARLLDVDGDHKAAALLAAASAFAEAGRFEDSIATAERALSAAEEDGHDRWARESRRRLALFRGGKPYRAAH